MDYLPLGGRRRGFTPRVSVSSSITHRCVVLVFAYLFPYLCLLFFVVNVILNWLRLFINSVYSLCSFFCTLCVCHKAWIGNFWFGGLNVHSVFYTIWTFISHFDELPYYDLCNITLFNTIVSFLYIKAIITNISVSFLV